MAKPKKAKAKKGKTISKNVNSALKKAAKNVKKAADNATKKKNTNKPSNKASGGGGSNKGSNTSNYSMTDVANNAVSKLSNVIDGLRVNNYNSYLQPGTPTGNMLRNDFIRDENYIRNSLNAATNASYDANRAQAIEDAIAAEDTSYANTRNAINEMRRNLIGSGSSGANVGAANATALQALLGLGQQNTQTTTESLQAINDVSRQRAAQLAQNAVEAINTANEATSQMHNVGTSIYNSDRSYAAQGAAEALGNLYAAIESGASQERQTAATNASQERMNTATNKANLDIEKTTKKTESVNKSTTDNTNRDYSTSINYGFNSKPLSSKAMSKLVKK